MGKNIIIGISDMAVAKAPEILATYALGSCVGICLYDKQNKIGGLSHILLPKNTNPAKEQPMKFADTAIPLLVEKMLKQGAVKSHLTAKIAGGAQMFAMNNTGTSVAQIGQRNVESVKETLRKVGIRIIAEDTGLNYGRTVFFDVATGGVQIKTAFGAKKDL